MMSSSQQINGLNRQILMSDLLLATGAIGATGRAGLIGTLGFCGSASLANAGWMSDTARQAPASGSQDEACGISEAIIGDAVPRAPFAGLEIWLSLAVLVVTVSGAILAYVMWVSGPGFLVMFVLLLFASGPFYLKGLDYLAGIDRNREV